MSGDLTVDAIRNCLEGVIPAAIATSDIDGIPNVSLLSQVHYVDGDHVALSYQFFNKTRRNVLANPRATVLVIDPATAAQYRLTLRYLHTETSGPLFESMKAKLAGIASHSGMQDVFRLLGADLYRVQAIVAVPVPTMPAPVRSRNLLAAVRRACERLATRTDLAGLLDQALAELRDGFGFGHALVMMLDESGKRLYAIASMGYERSGVGAEIGLGEGVIGVAAREGSPIRINHMTAEYSYSRAAGAGAPAATEIPFPGLAQPGSQLAVPVVAGRRVVGVLFVESPQELRFCWDDEDALATLAAQLGALMQALQAAVPADEPRTGPSEAAAAAGPPVVIRHYAADDSVFIDHDYLIKGVAGAIFCKLIRDHLQNGRREFTNRELRLAPDIRLPDQAENLEARLILLQRRLAERCDFLRIEKTGRGRFQLAVTRPLVFEEMPCGGGR